MASTGDRVGGTGEIHAKIIKGTRPNTKTKIFKWEAGVGNVTIATAEVKLPPPLS